MARQSCWVENRLESRWRCSKHYCIDSCYFSCHLCNVLFLLCVVLFFCFRVIENVLFCLMLFGRVTKQTHLVISNKILIHSTSTKFYRLRNDSVVSQMKDIMYVYILYWLPEELQVFLKGFLLFHTLYFIGTALSTVVNRFRFDSRGRS